ncbi:uncharacterized protein LOC135833658 [Planococcus citri]|uniref:uncharacterized protein LOC135833658 n=1 Tax=Planococcus citri TaxID=170843 RepID=UPI0031F92384
MCKLFSINTILVLFVFEFGYAAIKIDNDHPSYFTVFYDADDSKSISWLQNEFKAHYKLFEEVITFSFLPCYNAQLSSDGKAITCPDPDKTCYNNKLHACASDYFKEGFKLNDFLVCISEKEKKLDQCVGGDQKLLKTLDDCAKGPKGFELCLNYTSNLLPFNTLPSFLGDGFYKPPLDLSDMLCKQSILHYLKVPPSCSKLH